VQTERGSIVLAVRLITGANISGGGRGVMANVGFIGLGKIYVDMSTVSPAASRTD
jgi:hypothetical protein